ncbi:MAG: RNA 2',3'-cyclic phosphodiesterase [Acidimicrobiia bacterium]|nr:RNA 2',3'-cyclic phosphodiesterase [Acidimicrobiia bacterium]MDH5519731.1 RNA 2',3'-cyclic phosphodiesterase [Acidimicrobiia bacterium]
MIGPLFLAVEPDEESKSLLAQMLARAFDDEWPLPGKLSPPDNWHITVRFLGSVDDVTLDRLMAGLDEATLTEPVWPDGPIGVELRGVGTFPRPDNATVLWVGVESEPLIELAEAVEDLATSVGMAPEERPFRPHLTLSRVRPPQDLSDLVAVEWGRLRFTVDHLTLFRSQSETGGVRYEPLERFDI